MKKEKSCYSIVIVNRALDLLEQFNGDLEEFGITELIRRLRLTRHTVNRLLLTLESRNYIEKNKITLNYRLGLNTLQLGQEFIKKARLIRQAKPMLESLVMKCNETAHIAILKDFEVVYLDAIEPHFPIRVVSRVGIRLPFYCTASGKILAANLKDNILHEYFRRGNLKKYTINTISDPDEFTNHLKRITELGYSVDDEELEVGVKGVGAPIRDYTKLVVGAVSVSGPSIRFTPERISQELVPLVTKAAEKLSARLGYK